MADKGEKEEEETEDERKVSALLKLAIFNLDLANV